MWNKLPSVLQKNYSVPLASLFTLPKKSSLWKQYHPLTSARDIRIPQVFNESSKGFTTLFFTLEMEKKHTNITSNIGLNDSIFKPDKFRLMY